MDPLVNNSAVDQFFDNPAITDSFGAGEPQEIAGDFTAVDTSETSFYDPNARTTPTQAEAEPAHVEPVTPAVDYAAELAALRQQNAELALYKPLGDMIQRNPNFLQAVESHLQGAPAQAAPVAPKLERPIPPTKPAVYDLAEAYQVPGSESWKFREAQEAHNGAMFEYFEKKDAMREESVQTAQAQYQQRIQQQEAHTALSNELTTRYGFKPAEVAEFIQTMNDPASRNMDNLVALHRMNKQKQVAGTAGAVPAMKAAQKNVPLPVGIVGGNGGGQVRQLNDSDSFNSGLMSARRI